MNFIIRLNRGNFDLSSHSFKFFSRIEVGKKCKNSTQCLQRQENTGTWGVNTTIDV